MKPSRPAGTDPASHRLPEARWLARQGDTDLRRLLARTADPNVLSLALGLPDPDLFPAEPLAEAFGALGSAAYQLGPPTEALKGHVVELMARRGVGCTPEEVFLTAGAQQGMSLLARLWLEPGDRAVVEEMTYTGILSNLDALGAERVTVPVEPGRGPDLEALEAAFASSPRPKLFYTVADGHNPLGHSLDAGRRRRIATLARRHGVPVIEDSPYGLIGYGADGDGADGDGPDGDGPNRDEPDALRAFDPDWVVHVGTFSKILAPALRAGWVVAPESVVARLSVVKDLTDLDTATLVQRGLVEFLEAGHLPGHLAHLRRAYRKRRDALVAVLEARLPGQVRWSSPEHGFYLWLELPGTVDTTELLEEALETEGVAFLPGRGFAATDPERAASALRLAFCGGSPALVAEAGKRLCRVIGRALG